MNTGRRLARALNLRPGETSLVLQMSIPYFLIGVCIVLFETVAFALFLTTYGAEMLPVTYIINAIGVILISLLFLRLSARLSIRWRLASNLVLLLALLAAFYLGIVTSGAAWLIFLLPVAYELLKNLSKVAYWGLAIHIFDLRQGKRLFGLIGAGRWLAVIVVGLLVPLLVQTLGLLNLLLLATLSFLAATLLLLRTKFHIADRAIPPSRRPTQTTNKAHSGIWHNRYVLLIFGLVLLWFLTSFVVDNIYYDQAVRQFPSDDQLAAFLGIFAAARGVTTLFTTTFFSGFVSRRFGICINLLVLPLTLLLLGLLALAAGWMQLPFLLFLVMVAMKMFDKALGDADEQSMLSTLYQPLRAGQRDQVQLIAGGIVKPLAIGLAGAMLLGLHLLLQVEGALLLPFLLLLVAAWLLLALQLGRGYVQSLKEALPRRWLGDFSAEVANADSLQVLHEALNSPRSETVIHALYMMGQIAPRELAAVVPRLLAHPSADVRSMALQQIEHLRLSDGLPALRERIEHENEPAVRGQAIRSYAELGGPDALSLVLSFVDASEPAIRQGAMVGLLRSSGTAEHLGIDDKLTQLREDRDPHMRILAAQVIGEVGQSGYAHHLQPLFNDETVEVQRAALAAAGQIGDRRLWSLMLDKLSQPFVDAAAANALVRSGPAVLEPIQAAWKRPQQPRRVLSWLAKVCGRIGDEQAILLLCDYIDHPIPVVRTQILRALRRCGYRASNNDAARIHEQLSAEVAAIAWATAALLDIQHLPNKTMAAEELVQETLAADIAAGRRRILYLLTFLYDPDTIERIRRNLLDKASARHSYALELLDLTLDSSLKPLLFPALEPLAPQAAHEQLRLLCPQQSQLQTAAARLHEIISGPEERFAPWLQAAALYIAAEHGMDTVLEQARSALPTATIAQETAQRVYRQALPHTAQNSPSEAFAPLLTVEKMQLLKSSALFDGIDGDSLYEIAQLVVETHVPAGTTLFEEGSIGNRLYLVSRGTLTIHRGGVAVYAARRGDVLGELAVLGNQPRLASITTQTDAQLLHLDNDCLFNYMASRSEVAQRMLRFVSRILRDRHETYRHLKHDRQHVERSETINAVEL